MSCRSTKANSACTSLAQAVSELPDSDIQGRFHALKKEGKDAPAPSLEEYQDFLVKQRNLVKSADEIDYTRRSSMDGRLAVAFSESNEDGFTPPDGATFYALKNVVADAEIASERQRAADLAARLPTMSPADVDTELAGQYEKYYRIQDRLQACRRDLDYARRNASDSARRNGGQPQRNAAESLEAAERAVATYEAKSAKFLRRLGPYEDEYNARGRWSRYFEVTGNGSENHIHKDMNCSTCRPTTRYAWHPELSGKTEDEAVAEFGEKMGTCCFPSAPANPNYNGPGRRDRAAQEARAAERDERAAAKAAKAITRPDGTKLRDASGFEIKSLVTAKRELVSIQAYNAWLERDANEGGRNNDLIAKNRRVVDDIEQAIAHKTGQTVEEVRAEHAPKVAKKIAKGEW